MDSWGGGGGANGSGARRRISTGTSLGATELSGWLQVDAVTHYDAGNYTCVPSYAVPAWAEVHILHGEEMPTASLGGNAEKLDAATLRTRRVSIVGADFLGSHVPLTRYWS